MWTLNDLDLLLVVQLKQSSHGLATGGKKESKQIHQPLDAALAEATPAAIIINK